MSLPSYRSLATAIVAMLLVGCAARAAAPATNGAAFLPQSLAYRQTLHPRYAFSCKPADFRHKTVLSIKEGTAYDLPTFNRFQQDPTYYPVTGFCGVDNSFISRTDLWVDNSYSFHGQHITPKIYATANIRWADHPDIAVWEEAWSLNIFRETSADVHLALVRVVP